MPPHKELNQLQGCLELSLQTLHEDFHGQELSDLREEKASLRTAGSAMLGWVCSATQVRVDRL